jgi:hypothetical protein
MSQSLLVYDGICLCLFRLISLRGGGRGFTRYRRLTARPSRIVRAMAAARSAAIPALQMVETSEDNETAFSIIIFAFYKLAHCNSFIASSPYRGLRLIGDPS